MKGNRNKPAAETSSNDFEQKKAYSSDEELDLETQLISLKTEISENTKLSKLLGSIDELINLIKELKNNTEKNQVNLDRAAEISIKIQEKSSALDSSEDLKEEEISKKDPSLTKIRIITSGITGVIKTIISRININNPLGVTKKLISADLLAEMVTENLVVENLNKSIRPLAKQHQSTQLS